MSAAEDAWFRNGELTLGQVAPQWETLHEGGAEASERTQMRWKVELFGDGLQANRQVML